MKMIEMLFYMNYLGYKPQSFEQYKYLEAYLKRAVFLIKENRLL